VRLEGAHEGREEDRACSRKPLSRAGDQHARPHSPPCHAARGHWSRRPKRCGQLERDL